MTNISEEYPFDSILYGLVLKDSLTEEIVHFVGFWGKPTKKDIEGVEDEIQSDPNFAHLRDVSYTIELATDAELTHFKTLLKETM